MGRKKKRGRPRNTKSRPTRHEIGFNHNDLKDALWATIQDVRKEKIRRHAANAVASQAREICRVVKLELDIARLTNKQPKEVGGFLTEK